MRKWGNLTLKKKTGETLNVHLTAPLFRIRIMGGPHKRCGGNSTPKKTKPHYNNRKAGNWKGTTSKNRI